MKSKSYNSDKVKRKQLAIEKTRAGKQKEYNPFLIEKKWQSRWSKSKTYKTEEKSKKPKSYILDMFPYPSGEGLHVGHPKGYIATDVYSRFKRMNGFNVLHPMGWDAFGLPAENYAIKNKVAPQIAVAKNVKRFKKQLDIIGLDYDWSREINTTDPEYYRWTQWIFLQMYKKGLAYESYEPINWCSSCQTGLANEDLDDGKCERCGSIVEKKPIRQWVLKITDYADRLLADLDMLKDWPESIKESQRNWIGPSEGSILKFKVQNSKLKAVFQEIEVFTTRPDTLFGVTYVVLAPEHKLIKNLKLQITNWDKVVRYIEQSKKKTEIDRTDTKKEKTGVELKGIKAINPANNEEVPVWVADYVLVSYGTGAVMAVPAHDERDFEFAKKYKLPVREVVIPLRIDKKNPPVLGKKIVERKTIHALVRDPKNGKILCVKWKKFPWTGFIVGGVDKGEDIIEAARREVLEEIGYKNLKFIKILGGLVRAEYFAAHKNENRVTYSNAVLFELQNNEQVSISKEESDKHDVVWLDPKKINHDNFTCAELDLWFKRMDGESAFADDGVLINSDKFDGLSSEKAKKDITKFVSGKMTTKYKLRDWVFSRQRYWGEPIPIIHCPKDGIVPVPEKDLPVELPKVKNYEPTGTGESPLADITKWVNTKCPICKGSAKRETNTMPQWAGSSWYYLRYMDPNNKKALVNPNKEKYFAPVDMYVGGAEHATRHLIYARFWHKFLYDIGLVSTKEPFSRLKNQGLIMGPDDRKMSKRFGNVINPDDIVSSYGADTLRVYEMFMGPFDQAIKWSTESMIGSRRFLDKVWKLQFKVLKTKNQKQKKDSDLLLHKTIKKVEEDIEKFNFNTAISAMMILINDWEKKENIPRADFGKFLTILAPFAPHITEEMWNINGYKKTIHKEIWPQYDQNKLIEKTSRIVVQINGKVRAMFEINSDMQESEIKEKVIALDDVKKWLNGGIIKKIIYIKNKLINIVI